MSVYEPNPALRRDWITCCWHCGQLRVAHRSNGRCYTQEELGARLAWWQRTGKWPGPDEGCTLEEATPLVLDMDPDVQREEA